MSTCTLCGHSPATPAQACPACGAPGGQPAGQSGAAARRPAGRPPWPVPPRQARGGRVLILATAAAVLVAAGIGTALAVARFHRPQAAASARISPRLGTIRTGAPAARRGQPGAMPSPSVSPVTQAGRGPVAVRPALAGRPDAASLVTFLTGYFTAINQHDYLAYRRLFSPRSQLALTPARFISGYGSSTDSGAVLDAFSVPGPGQLAVTVSFTSRQRPGDGPAGGTCTDWRITLYLSRHGDSYIIGAPPASYRAAFRSCL